MNAGDVRSAAAGNVVVQLRSLKKDYRGQSVVSVEKLDFRAGERVLITGSNGSGKSTLLRLLIGASRPYSGRLQVSGALAAGPIGYSPQTGGLAPEQTIATNLALRRYVYGRRSAPAEEAWYVRRLGLTRYLDRQFWELSGGIQKLASVAAALHVEPSGLVLDEPFSGLDESKRAVLAAILNQLGPRLQLLVVSSPTAGESHGVDFNRSIELVGGRIS